MMEVSNKVSEKEGRRKEKEGRRDKIMTIIDAITLEIRRDKDEA